MNLFSISPPLPRPVQPAIFFCFPLDNGWRFWEYSVPDRPAKVDVGPI
jgi:hypothetical protein